MFEVRTPRKGLKDILTMLGDKYQIKVIDLENVIYRDYGDYDVEVSGLDNNRKNMNAFVYVWSKKPSKIVEKYPEIKSYGNLKELLDILEKRFLFPR